MLQFAAATGITGGGHDRVRRKAYRTPRSNQIHAPPLKWFSERLKRVTSEFTDLIEQQESTMCPCQLARSHAGTSADEPRNRDVVMRCP